MDDSKMVPQINSIQPIRRKIYQLIIEDEGYRKYIWKVIEELSELQAALAEHARNEGSKGAVAKELIDAEYQLEKLRYLLESEVIDDEDGIDLEKIEDEVLEGLKKEFI